MGWLEKFGAGVIARLIEKLVTWFKDFATRQVEKARKQDENKAALDMVRTAETPEEFDEAARALAHRNDKP